MPDGRSDRISGPRPGIGPGTLLAGLLAVSIVTLITVAFEHEAGRRGLEQQRTAVLNGIGSIRSALEGALWRDSAIVHGIVVKISERPDLDQQEFAQFAGPLISGYDTIKYIAAARDLVVTHVWPMTDYDRIIGLDYRGLPNQFPAIREVMNERLPMMVGPIKLYQGGRGVILRAPVLVQSKDGSPDGKEQAWGVVSAVIDYDRLLAESGVTDIDSPFDILILGSDGVTGNAIPLNGDINLLNRDPVITPLGFPGNQWRIAATPKGGWDPRANVGNMPRLLAFLSIVAIVVGCWLKLRSDRVASAWEESVRGSVSRFRSLFENASDGILLVDPSSGQVRDANRRAASLLHQSENELRDVFLSDLIAKRKSENGAEAVLGIAGGKPEIMRMSFSAGEAVVEAEISASRLVDGSENLLLIHIRDIGARREHEEALRRARIEAENANALKSRFLANFSHEIRTPLNAIVGFSEIMKEGLFGPVEPPRYNAYVGDIHKSGQHLLAMINDILDLSRIEAGEMPIDRNFVALGPLVEDSMAMTAPLAEAGKVKVEPSPDLARIEVACDPMRLRQMLINLLSNAVKFTMPGGSVSIMLTPASEGGATLEIRDTGIGMSEKDIEDALRPFGQVASHRTDRHVGSGLGLTLTRALAELQGLSFRLESAPGEGTIVSIGFPADAVHPLRQPDMFRASVH